MLEADWIQFEDLECNAFPNDFMDKNGFHRQIESDHFYGGFIGKILVGYLLLRPSFEYGHINRIAVHYEHLRKGIGSKLIGFAETVFKRLGCTHTGLFVERENEAAIALYNKNGLSIMFDSFHFIIDIEHLMTQIIPHLQPQDYQLREIIDLDEHILRELESLSPKTNISYLNQLFMEDHKREIPRNLYFALFKLEEIRGFARFNQDFSGSMPFIFGEVAEADILLFFLLEYKLEKNDYLRMTFDGKPEYADTLKQRGYNVHHELFKMEKQIRK